MRATFTESGEVALFYFQKGEKMSGEKNKVPGRDERGRFTKGNNISKDQLFEEDNDKAKKYKDEYADQLIEFFSNPPTRVEYAKKYDKEGNLISETPIEFKNDFPTMGLFARKIGVSVSTLKAWAGITEDGKYKHRRFASAYARVKDWAGGMIESGALSGKLDTNMAKFLLVNNYGMTEKTQQDASLVLSVKMPEEIDEESF